MATKKRNRTSTWGQIVVFACFVIVGAACGVLIARHLISTKADMPPGVYLFSLGLFIIEMYIAFFLQIIIHEAGHLVFGLLTGYRFTSFRIGSFIWIKEDKGMRLKRLSHAGTGGQCLMCPPDMVDGAFPFVLYNLGGSFLNILSGLIFFAAYWLYKDTAYISILFILTSIIGLAFALTNGIPMRFHVVDNDGYNALSLGKHPEALRSFWVQLKTNEQLSKGIRLKDMPEEWFFIPPDAQMKNSMIAVMGVFAANRMMDLHAFDDAAHWIDRLLHMESAIVGLHRGLITCDSMYCELIGENNKERLSAMHMKQQKKFMKAMRKFPSVMRTEYAYALIAEGDIQRANTIRHQFEKCARSYPYQSDIESERMLMQIAKEAAAR